MAKQNSIGSQHILQLISPVKKPILCCILFSILTNVCAACITRLLSDMLDRFIPSKDISSIMTRGIIITIVGFAFFICYSLSIHYNKCAQYQMQHDLRKIAFIHILKCKYRYFAQKSFGQVNTNIVQDVENLCDILFNQVFNSVSSILFFMFSFSFLFIINSRITLVLMVYMTVVVIYMYALKHSMVRYANEYADSRAELNMAIDDVISHRKSIIMYGQEKTYVENVAQKDNVKVKAWLRLNIFTPLIQSSIELSILISYLIVFICAWFEIRNGSASLADLFTYLAYIPQLWNKFGSAIDIYTEWTKAGVFANRIVSSMTEESEPSLLTTLTDYEPAEISDSYGLVINNISFSYYEHNFIFKNFSALLNRYGIYGIVGPSGCGKSTLFDIITGLYEVDCGDIYINGKAIKSYPLSYLRKTIGIIHQEPYILSGTILDNIQCFDQNITKAQILECAQKYRLNKPFSLLSHTWNNTVNRSSRTITLGQKRLISILRILVREPAILLCDEITAGADSNTEKVILDAIKIYSLNHICLLISHKESDLHAVDSIIHL